MHRWIGKQSIRIRPLKYSFTVARQKFESNGFNASLIRQLLNILYAYSNLILRIPTVRLNDCLDTVRHGVR
jgi:hypothetical protein